MTYTHLSANGSRNDLSLGPGLPRKEEIGYAIKDLWSDIVEAFMEALNALLSAIGLSSPNDREPSLESEKVHHIEIEKDGTKMILTPKDLGTLIWSEDPNSWTVVSREVKAH